MKVLVDSTAWSETLRRRQGNGDPSTLSALNHLIENEAAFLIGAIRQETLSGIRDRNFFTVIRNILRQYPEIVPTQSDYERAGEFYTTCLSKGISPSHIDMLICAISVSHDLSILTLDKDFDYYARALPIRLFKV